MKMINNKMAAFTIQVKIVLLTLLVFITFTIPVTAEQENTPTWLPELLKKEKITVVITDSGLGGLSVVADAAKKLQLNPVFKEVELIFVNALFTNEGGYNSLQKREEKLKVFNNALQSMQDRYQPDIILVACNTLSVLVPDTEFSRTSPIPVLGIVEDGVQQIAEQLGKNSASKNIIFATETTVSEGTHTNQLLALGISSKQLVAQSCPQLTLFIEQGYDSMDTEMLIDAYVDEAVSKMGKIEGPLSVSFNCTHFGYSQSLWKEAFESRGIKVNAFLNPNIRMIDILLPEALNQRYEKSDVNVKVVSMIDIPADRQASIGRYLHNISPATETALANFEQIPDLFKWRNLLSGAVE